MNNSIKNTLNCQSLKEGSDIITELVEGTQVYHQHGNSIYNTLEVKIYRITDDDKKKIELFMSSVENNFNTFQHIKHII